MTIQFSDIPEQSKKLLEEIQQSLYTKAKNFMDEHTFEIDSYEEFKQIMQTTRGFIRAFWCEDKACEEKIKEETKATTRLKKLDEKKENGTCIYCGKSATQRWYFAQSY